MHGSQARLVAVQVGIYSTVLMAVASMIVVVVMVVIMVKIGMGIVYMPGLVVSITVIDPTLYKCNLCLCGTSIIAVLSIIVRHPTTKVGGLRLG